MGFGNFGRRNGSGGGASLTADKGAFLTSVSAGALIANLSHPFGGGEVFSLVGSVPGQLALSGATIVAGGSAALAGSNYSVTVRAAKAGRAVEEPFSFAATTPIGLPALSFAGAVSQAEGTSGSSAINFTLNLTRNGHTEAIPYTWTYTAGTANAADFAGGVLPSGSGTFAAGETSKQIAVAIAGDTVVEPDEAFQITVSLPDFPGVTAIGSATIVNDDATAPTALPQSASIVAKFSASDVTPQSDNTDLSSWTDSIGGAVANAVVAPKYRTNRLNGKPSIQFANASSQCLNIDTNNTAILAAINGRKYTVLAVMKGANGSQAFNFVFGVMTTGQSGLALQANSTAHGLYTAVGKVPYTSDLAAFSTLCATSTDVTLGAGNGVSRAYINGGCVTPSQSAGPVAGASISPSIGKAGSTWTQYYWTGELFDLLVWSVELTNAEVKQAEKWAREKYGLTPAWAGQSSYPIFAGDSITMGYQVSVPAKEFPYIASMTAVGSGGLGLKYGQWDNVGRGGVSIGGMGSYAAGDVDNVSAQTGIPTTLAAWEFYNTRTSGTVASQMASYLNGRISGGISASRIVFGTTTDYTSHGAEKSAYTNYWDTSANRTGLMGAYVPIHLNANIGVDGANASATYFYADHVHLIDAGANELALGANMFAAKLTAVV